MKKVKSILCLLLALMMLMPSVVVPATAASNGHIALSINKQTVHRGDTITVDVALSNNPGMVTMKFKIAYSEGLELIGVNDTGLFSGQLHSKNYVSNPYPLTWDNSLASENITVNGVLATLTFKVKADAAFKDHTITVSHDKYGVWDYDLNPLTLSASNGKVTVECVHSYGAWTETTKPTCSAFGEEARTCSICGNTETKPLDKIPHTYGAWEKHDAEQHKKVCECGDIQYAKHEWDAGKITTEPTCKDTGIKTYTCTVCGETKTEVVPVTTNHTWGKWEKGTEEVHIRTCSVCGKTESAAHTWDNGKVTTEATHTATGVKTYTCTVCGKTKTETIDKTPNHTYGVWEKHDAEQHKKVCECGDIQYAKHEWDAGKITTEPTCKDTGIKTYTCTVCGEIKTEVVPVTTNHTWGKWEKGTEEVHIRTCSVCGKTESAAHTWDNGKVTTEATHTATGVKTYTCTVCGKTKTETIDKTPNHTYGAWEKHDAEQHKKVCECGDIQYAKHEWDAGKITTEPTCKDTGIKTYTCTVCGEIKTEVVSVTTNHIWGEWKKDTADVHTRTCSVCGKTESVAHTWNNGEITKPASHVSEGIKTYTCTACGETKTETLPKTNTHGYGAWEKHDAEQHKKVCECGDIQYAKHGWDAGKITTEPTCKDTGIKTYTCTVCGEIKTEVVPVTTNHTWGEWKKDTADVHTRTCSVCGKTESVAHTWNNGEITKPASHVSEGIKTYTCTACGETKTETLPKTNTHGYGAWEKHDAEQHKKVCECGDIQYAKHEWDAGKITTEPTCKDTGIKTYTCTVCGETKTEVVPVTTNHTWGEWKADDNNGEMHTRICSVCGKAESGAHKWDNGKVTTEATHTSTGVKTYACTDCGKTKTEVISSTPDHHYGAWEKVDENQHKKTCECGDIQYANHLWDKGVITTAPTCKDTGIRTYTCTDCGATKTEVVAVTDSHIWDKGTVTKEPTTDDTGLKLYVCTICGANKTAVLEKLHKHIYSGEWKSNHLMHWRECECGAKANITVHLFGKGTVVKEATHTTEGLEIVACFHCGAKIEKTIAKLDGHVYGEWTSYDVDKHVHTCECGEAEYAVHNYGEWIVVKNATTISEGLSVSTCADCGATQEYVIPKLPEETTATTETTTVETTTEETTTETTPSVTTTNTTETTTGESDQNSNMIIWITVGVAAIAAVVVIVLIIKMRRRK